MKSVKIEMSGNHERRIRYALYLINESRNHLFVKHGINRRGKGHIGAEDLAAIFNRCRLNSKVKVGGKNNRTDKEVKIFTQVKMLLLLYKYFSDNIVIIEGKTENICIMGGV